MNPELWLFYIICSNLRFTIPPTVDKMSNNKFDALGSDDSEGEGDPGQTLVEVTELKLEQKYSIKIYRLRRGHSHL